MKHEKNLSVQYLTQWCPLGGLNDTGLTNQKYRTWNQELPCLSLLFHRHRIVRLLFDNRYGSKAPALKTWQRTSFLYNHLAAQRCQWWLDAILLPSSTIKNPHRNSHLIFCKRCRNRKKSQKSSMNSEVHCELLGLTNKNGLACLCLITIRCLVVGDPMVHRSGTTDNGGHSLIMGQKLNSVLN